MRYSSRMGMSRPWLPKTATSEQHPHLCGWAPGHGGQRQRVGIARALYHNPQVLILDEATSALDNLTEQAVMEAVNNLGHDITIILIAHRLSTVRNCDQIFLLEQGELKAQGNFEELTRANDRFRTMASLY